jgi:hypothetical protein
LRDSASRPLICFLQICAPVARKTHNSMCGRAAKRRRRQILWASAIGNLARHQCRMDDQKKKRKDRGAQRTASRINNMIPLLIA